jgi:signal transduction histidine kinase
VIEQVISNAVKYTAEGGVRIYMDEPGLLCISDTGIGISAEDLPRVFENGFTGFNGREDKRASGIGLYLCKRIMDNLAHTITAESEPGKGTTIKMNLKTAELGVDE